MAKPTKHFSKWRIRWTDEEGQRCSAVYDTQKEAAHQLRLREVAVEEVKRGVRGVTIKPKTFDQLCDYWLENRAQEKRSKKDDISPSPDHWIDCQNRENQRNHRDSRADCVLESTRKRLRADLFLVTSDSRSENESIKS